MKGEGRKAKWLEKLRRWAANPRAALLASQPRIGLALGGGFARGLAHVGVLRVFQEHHIPIYCVGGVSAGAIVAGAFASGTSWADIARVGSKMRFTDVARWSLSRMGFAASTPMDSFLNRLLKCYRFEDMPIPLTVIATDLSTGEPVQFRGHGDVKLPIRASCSYPGLFQPIRCDGRLLVDGAMSVDLPVQQVRRMGANRVIAVHLPMQSEQLAPTNMFQVVNRSIQIMQMRMEPEWRRHADLVIEPDVRGMEWDSFRSAQKLIEAGEKAALAVLPKIRAWLGNRPADAGFAPASTPDSVPA